jgi:hypothetical protein
MKRGITALIGLVLAVGLVVTIVADGCAILFSEPELRR